MNDHKRMFRREFLGAVCAPLLPAQESHQARDRGVVPFGFLVEGSRLEINCLSSLAPYIQPDWGIRAEILEPPDDQTRETRWEKRIPGFTLEDCDNVRKDALAHTVSWKGRSDLSALKGRAVYLVSLSHRNLSEGFPRR